MRSNELPMRRLTLTLTTLVLLVTILSTCALQYLPDEPLHLRRNLTLYALFVMVVSFLGLLGGIQRNATLINLFASHLLLDALLYFIPRILLLNMSFQMPNVLCTSFSPSPPSSSSAPPDSDPTKAGHPDVLGSASSATSWHHTLYKPQWIAGESCSAWTWSLELLFLVVVIAMMGVQVWLALGVRRYAVWLEREATQRERLLKGGFKEKEIC